MDQATTGNKTLIGWRKFSLAVFFSLVGTLALFTDKLDGGQFLVLVSSIMGIFAVGNIAEYQVKK